MKAKTKLRVHRLQTEVESLKAWVVQRDEVIASVKGCVKDLEAENMGLQDPAVAAEKGEEEAKKRETTSSYVVNEAYRMPIVRA